jgi:hypothetical protein
MFKFLRTGGAYREGHTANMRGVSFKENPYVFGSPRWFAWDDGYTAAACCKLGNVMQKKASGFVDMVVTVGAAWLLCGVLMLGGVALIYWIMITGGGQ